MATRQPKKLSHHYGKRTASSKKPMSNFFAAMSSATTPEKSTATRHPATATPAAHLDSSSPEPLNHPEAVEMSNTSVHSSGKIGSSERKRKRYQLYSGNAEGKDPLQSSDDSSPSGRPARRSRVSSPEISSRILKDGVHAEGQHLRSTSLDAMDVDFIEAKLSSPPPTPTQPKDRRREVSKKPLPFSPNTMHSFDSMVVTSAKKKQSRQHQIPVRLAREKLPKPHPSVTSGRPIERLFKTSRKYQVLKEKQPLKPRKRLIDTLAEQSEEPDESEVEDGLQKSESQVSFSHEILSSQTSNTFSIGSQLPPEQAPKAPRMNKDSNLRTYTRSNSGLRRTFGQGQTVLEENDPVKVFDDLRIPTAPALKGRRLEVGTPKKQVKSSFDFENDESSVGASPKAKMRDIHELRQAGANTRAADEMSDLSDQLGTPSGVPSSSRRATLLQIADKIREKDFRRRLRDHGVEAMIFKDLSDEGDVIAGYLLAATLIHILATSPSPNIVRYLRASDAGVLFGRLLEIDQGIKKLAKERKNNLSKRSQASLVSIQSALLELPCWKTKPPHVTPRALALQCLNLLITQDVNLGKDMTIFPAPVTNGLFHVLAAAREKAFWDEPDAVEEVNVHCALTVLEYHAVKAMEVHHDDKSWMAHHLPTVAEVFGAVLELSTDLNGELVSSVLKLVLNMTHTSTAAPEVFVEKGFLPTLASSVCNSFSQTQEAISADEWSEAVYNGLVLRLGILINFAEKCMSVRQAVFENHGEKKSPMDQLIRLFWENHRKTADADSEAKGQLNVAFGYLSVLLGYLSLYPPVRQSFKAGHGSKSMGPLLESIREFLTHHKSLEASMLESMGDDPMSQESSSDGIQGLVDQLERDAAYD